MDTFSGRNHKSSDNVWACLHQTGSDWKFRSKRAIYVAGVTGRSRYFEGQSRYLSEVPVP